MAYNLDLTGDEVQSILEESPKHIANQNNPHGVTKAQVGLGNVDNTSDADKPVSTAQQAALNVKADKTEVAAVQANLDALGLYVDADGDICQKD